MDTEAASSKISPTRQQIIDCAQTLFMEQGIQGTSLADIAKQAGISKGTLFYHFKSKDELILEIAYSHVLVIGDDILNSIKDNPCSSDFAKHLENLIHTILHSQLRNQLHVYLIEECVTRNPGLQEAMHQMYFRWLTSIIDAIAPEFGAKSPAIAHLTLAIIDGLIVQGILGIKNPPIKDMVQLILGQKNSDG